jgi:hypothetical protein
LSQVQLRLLKFVRDQPFPLVILLGTGEALKGPGLKGRASEKALKGRGLKGERLERALERARLLAAP